MTTPDTTSYRPALDGIRALAVVAVLLFHADVGARLRLAPGGFIGVSVFFTLSGYLITTLLLNEQRRQGSISLSRFYARRLRRLLPAAYACILAVIIAIPWWTASQRDKLPGDVVAAVANIANWHFAFAKQTYQDLFTGVPSPLAHFWSLAIEEQCYLILPLVVVLLGRSRRVLAGVAAAMVAVSLVATLATNDFGLRYNATYIRGGELFVGVLLAAIAPSLWNGVGGRLTLRRAADVAGLVGTLALVVAVWRTPVNSSFLANGGFLLIATGSAAMIVAALAGTLTPRLLTLGPLPLIGRVSYGLYLYHWPVFLLLTSTRTGIDGWALFGLRLVITGAVTAASYRLLEQPIRHVAQPLGHSLAVAASVAAVLAALVVTVPRPTISEQDALHQQGDSGLVDFASSSAPSVASASAVTTTIAPPKPTILVVGSEPAAGIELTNAGGNVIDQTDPTCLVLAAETPTCPDRIVTWAAAIETTHPAMLVVSIGNAERSASVDGAPVDATTFDGLKRQVELLNGRIASLLDQLTASTSVTLVLSDRAPSGNILDQGIGIAADAHPQIAMVRSPSELLRVTGLEKPETIPTVMVIGDSTSLDLARALNTVGAAQVNVVWAGVLNCPFAAVDAQRSSAGVDWGHKDCADYRTKLPPLIDRYQPDAIVMLAGLGELWQMRYLDGTSSDGPSDANFIVQHDQAITELFAIFGARPVLIGDSPDLSARGVIPAALITDDRVAALNIQIARWIAAHPTALLLPYRQMVSDFELMHGSVRPDGIHVDAASLETIASTAVLPALLATLAGSSPAP